MRSLLICGLISVVLGGNAFACTNPSVVSDISLSSNTGPYTGTYIQFATPFKSPVLGTDCYQELSNNAKKYADDKVKDLQAQIAQLQQQMQEAMSKKIDETVTAKLTESSSTLVSTAVGHKLAEKNGDTTVLSSAVIDALKVTDDRSALNQDSEGKALAANKFKIKGLSNYSFDGHHFIMATLSASYDCSNVQTNIIYLPMNGNESSTQAMLLSTAFAFHRAIDVNPDPQVHEVVGNVPVESSYAHNCVLNIVNVD